VSGKKPYAVQSAALMIIGLCIFITMTVAKKQILLI